jgi:hypothetical protein
MAMAAMAAAAAGAPGQRAEQRGYRHGGLDIRQQLFGRQWQREAQEGLIALLTTLHTRLAAAGGARSGAKRDAPRARAAVLQALAEGVNGLARWHREQMQAAPGGGAWNLQSADLTSLLLAGVQQHYPLFAAARASGGRLDCSEVVEGVGQLRGAEGDALYTQALSGLTFLLKECFARLATDAPTAPVARALEDAWAELVIEVEALR